MTTNPTASLTVDFPPVANRDDMMDALGRNDWFRSIGLHILPMESQRRIRLEPVNSRGNIGRCAIELPLDEKVLRAVAAKLLDLADQCTP